MSAAETVMVEPVEAIALAAKVTGVKVVTGSFTSRLMRSVKMGVERTLTDGLVWATTVLAGTVSSERTKGSVTMPVPQGLLNEFLDRKPVTKFERTQMLL